MALVWCRRIENTVWQLKERMSEEEVNAALPAKPEGAYRILHTADWHIGKMLHARKRYEEFEAFLDWLSDTIQRAEVDALLMAGDVFDTGTPSNRSQELYYKFLCRVAGSACRHIVVVAGNHDSPSFLDAPRELLKVLRVHVVGSITDRVEDEVIVLDDAEGKPAMVVCAVPYLRDRDIRTVAAGESVEDKERNLVQGIREHYLAVGNAAVKTREQLDPSVPIVGMGHLFTAGGKAGDGVRELYVGSLAHVEAGIFPDCFDYLALGHLHVPQVVGGQETLRYSGSPIPMGFGEAGQQKSVCLVDFTVGKPAVQLVEIPTFQRLRSVRGNWEEIDTALRTLRSEGVPVWLEVIYTGESVIPDLRERLDEALQGTDLECLRSSNNRIVERVLGAMEEGEALEDLDEHQVFERLLSKHEVPDEQRTELRRTYQEVVLALKEADVAAQ